jgi:predicted Rossmann-fold nucleotide-binding protein
MTNNTQTNVLPRRIEKLCVFCGSSTGSDPAYFEATNQLSREIANAGVTLVVVVGRVGLMGIGPIPRLPRAVRSSG